MAHRHTPRALLIAASLIAISGAVQAQSAGSWMGKVGANQITPKVSSGDLSAPSLPNTEVDVKKATSAIVTLTYMVTDNVSFEFYAGLPYKHDVVGAGSIAGVGKIGSVKQVSPTLFGQYRFLDAGSALRPYAGLGLTYAYFYGAQGTGTLTAMTNPGGPPTTMKASSAFGLSPQLGAAYRFDDHWFIDGSVIKTYLKNHTDLSTGQRIETKLDPLSVNLSLGYRF